MVVYLLGTSHLASGPFDWSNLHLLELSHPSDLPKNARDSKNLTKNLCQQHDRTSCGTRQQHLLRWPQNHWQVSELQLALGHELLFVVAYSEASKNPRVSVSQDLLRGHSSSNFLIGLLHSIQTHSKGFPNFSESSFDHHHLQQGIHQVLRQ